MPSVLAAADHAEIVRLLAILDLTAITTDHFVTQLSSRGGQITDEKLYSHSRNRLYSNAST